MPPSKLARLTLGFIFIYQGLVPKLMFLDTTELYLNQLHLDLALVPVWFTAQLMAKLAGIGEILLGLLIIIVARKNWPIWLAIVALIVLLLDCVL
ncbi:MAG: DoxX family membrane protein, partial [Moraxellaceae bacterium]